jgi:cytochrome c oxidase cbb3-type subunit III
MKPKQYKKMAGILFFGLLPILIQAQTSIAESSSYFSNALFNSMLILVLILLLVIFALSNVLKSVLENEAQQIQKKEKTNVPFQGPSLILLFSLLASQAFAQETKIAAIPIDNDGRIGGLDLSTFYFLLAIIVIEIIVIYFLYNTIQGFIKEKLEKNTVKKIAKVVVKEKSLLEIINASVAIEREFEIMTDHNYDGIRELDNDLPPWWKYGFILTIITSVLYLLHYHGLRTGDLQIAEYKKEVLTAKLEIDVFMKNSANNVDETTVKFLNTPTDLNSGKDIFIATCVACHNKLGEGGVGPNLTDQYWIHGGGLSDVFKTIKYGWPDKGMKAWKEDLSPMQIAQVASYIKTLVGTNPPNAKAPQGDMYVESIKSDSTEFKSDSVTVKDLNKNSVATKSKIK